jgi:hypothetical protein
MKQSTHRHAVKHPKLCLSGLLIMALAFSAVAGRRYEPRATGSTPGNCVPTAEIDYLTWHRQQSGAVELDSVTASLRLFTTIADQFAADGIDGKSHARPVPSAACGKVFS